MRRLNAAGWSITRLRLILVVFFLLICVPSIVLIRLALGQIRWESFHGYQTLATDVGRRINERLTRLVAIENNRSFSDYQYLVVEGGVNANFLQRSPLSHLEQTHLPGLIGYFQVDARGRFSTPLLPDAGDAVGAYGLSTEERRERLAVREQLYGVLARNRLVPAGGSIDRKLAEARTAELGRYVRAPTDAPASRDRDSDDSWLEDAMGAAEEVQGGAAQVSFDTLSRERQSTGQRASKAAPGLGRVDELKLRQRFKKTALPPQPAPAESEGATVKKRVVRQEQIALPSAVPVRATPGGDRIASAAEELRVLTFESEIDPFELSLLGSGHLVLYRNVWRDGQRYIQGALLEQPVFLTELFERAFVGTALARMSDLVLAYGGEVLRVIKGAGGAQERTSPSDLDGELLFQARPATPWSDFELLFTIERLPVGPAGIVMYWTAAVLGLALIAGFFGMYRIGLRQIQLVRQQQDFVSAVSHELKTPLTSIRMYSELLREGWTAEEKKAAYYDFIYEESERLSRLIANVLQLARLTRSELKVEIRPSGIAQLLDSVRSKVATQVERAGFALHIDCPDELQQQRIEIDPDAFTQIMINLVDNALKFAAAAERKRIDLRCWDALENMVVFAVRDYGPGVPRNQSKKIFRLFYRMEDELTRETAGTGIGLALVQRLAHAMGGSVEVVNQSPGVEFRVSCKQAR